MSECQRHASVCLMDGETNINLASKSFQQINSAIVLLHVTNR